MYNFFIKVVLLLLFFGCGQSNTLNKTIVLEMGLYPKTFNSYNGGDWYTGQITDRVWESMLSSDEETYKVLPLLAEEWSKGKDNRTYFFTINSNAYFSDNVPVTADDVVFTFETLYDTFKSPLAQGWRSNLGEMEKIEKINKYKVMIKMKKVHFNHLRMLGGVSILPKHIYSKGTFNKDFDRFVIGSGAYVLVSNKNATKKNVILKRNPNWWGIDNLPSLKAYNQIDKIKYRIFKEKKKIYLAVKKRQLYFSGVSSEDFNLYKKDKVLNQNGNFTLVQKENDFPSSWWGVALNIKRAPLNEKKFRQALQLSLNREEINKKIYNQLNRPAASPISMGSPYSGRPKPIKYNPNLAKKYLSDLGYTNIKRNGILYKIDKNGKEVEAKITIFFSGARHEKWLTMFKEQAKKIGIEIDIRKKEWLLLSRDMNERKFQALCVGWSGGSVYPGGIRQLFSAKAARTAKSSNFTQLENERIDELLDLAEKEQSDQKRYSYFHEIEKIIIDEQPYIFLFQSRYYIYVYWNDLLKKKEWKYYTGVTHKIWGRWTTE